MQAQDIEAMLTAGIPGCVAEVHGDDGTHFDAVIISEQFAGKTKVQQHQIVYAALGDAMGDAIHALSIQTFTPEQWRQKRARQLD